MVRLLLAVVLLAGFTGCGGHNGEATNGLVGDTSRGSVRLRFDDTSESNFPSTHIRANDIGVTFYEPTMGLRAINVGGWVDDGGGSFHKSWLLIFSLFGEPAAGKVYSFDALDGGQPSLAPDTAYVVLQDYPPGNWMASGGSVTVQSLVGLRAIFSFDAVTMVPDDLNAMGTVTMSGPLMIANINSVCNFCPE